MSRRLSALNLVLRLVAKPRLRRTTDPLAARRDFQVFSRLLLARGRDVRIEAEPRRAGLPEVTWAGPKGAAPEGVVLYFHGGGYIAGSPSTHRGLIARLAQETRLSIAAPDYRLAPEHPLPAALEDAEAAWAGLRTRGYSPGQIVIGGDSAGGGLALSLVSRLCLAGSPPAGAFAFSPWTDLTGSGPSHQENADRDPLLPADRLRDLVGFALGDLPPANPLASPLFAAYPGCPPLLMQVSLSEILRDDTLRLAARLQAEGAPVTVETWPDTPHAWPVFTGLIPEADAAIASVAAFARRCLSPGL